MDFSAPPPVSDEETLRRARQTLRGCPGTGFTPPSTWQEALQVTALLLLVSDPDAKPLARSLGEALVRRVPEPPMQTLPPLVCVLVSLGRESLVADLLHAAPDPVRRACAWQSLGPQLVRAAGQSPVPDEGALAAVLNRAASWLRQVQEVGDKDDYAEARRLLNDAVLHACVCQPRLSLCLTRMLADAA